MWPILPTVHVPITETPSLAKNFIREQPYEEGGAPKLQICLPEDRGWGIYVA